MNKKDVKEALKAGVVKVVFIRTDGTEREMLCTLEPSYVDKVYEKKYSTPIRKVNENVQSVYDVENSGWRSFRWNSVIQVNDTVFTSN